MTHQISTAEIVRRLDAGERVGDLARSLGVSYEVIRYRVRSTGRKPKDYRKAVMPRRVIALRDNFETLIQLTRYLERKRNELINKMGDTPGPKTLNNLGELNDFLYALQELTE